MGDKIKVAKRYETFMLPPNRAINPAINAGIT